MPNRHAEPYYGEYLQLDKLLDAQHPRTPEAHDETLFIIVHQVYELWFKQILHELSSVQTLFDGEGVEERALGMIDARLERISVIQRLLSEQIQVLETMTPLDFLDFRDALSPASGFQSVQFREIELRLGVRLADPANLERSAFYRSLREGDRQRLRALVGQYSLFQLVERWLSRMPFLHYGDYDFWRDYLKATAAMLRDDLERLEGQRDLPEAERQLRIRDLSDTIARFDDLFDSERYHQLRRENKVRLGQEAMLAALFIQLYRDEPILHQPFRVLNRLVEIDEGLSTWRYQHMIMVQRMLGRRLGTGGTSGADYLRRTTEQPRVFEDLFNLASFLVPRSRLPELPEKLHRDLDFHFNGHGAHWGV